MWSCVEGVRAGLKAAAITCVVTAIPTVCFLDFYNVVYIICSLCLAFYICHDNKVLLGDYWKFFFYVNV